MKRKISKKNTPPPPTVKREVHSQPSLVGNIIGSIGSGFGFGTGIEAARSIFGGNKQQVEVPNNYSNNNNANCEMLFKLIETCENKNMNCDDLVSKFSNSCINMQE